VQLSLWKKRHLAPTTTKSFSRLPDGEGDDFEGELSSTLPPLGAFASSSLVQRRGKNGERNVVVVVSSRLVVLERVGVPFPRPLHKQLESVKSCARNGRSAERETHFKRLSSLEMFGEVIATFSISPTGEASQSASQRVGRHDEGKRLIYSVPIFRSV